MNLLAAFKRLFGKSDGDATASSAAPSSAPPKPGDPPTAAEWAEAKAILKGAERIACMAKLGGKKPAPPEEPENRWGGTFLGHPGETAPLGASGKPMQPVVQIRGEAFPPDVIPQGIELLTFWLDMDDQGVPLMSPLSENQFAVRTYGTLDGLVPITDGASRLPKFPMMFLEPPIPQQPSWEDFALAVPDRVAWSNDSDWFFNSITAGIFDHQQTMCPVKLGGWPTWIQGTQTPKGAAFAFQIDSTQKGKLMIGDSGSLYVFHDRTTTQWSVMSDFY